MYQILPTPWIKITECTCPLVFWLCIYRAICCSTFSLGVIMLLKQHICFIFPIRVMVLQKPNGFSQTECFRVENSKQSFFREQNGQSSETFLLDCKRLRGVTLWTTFVNFLKLSCCKKLNHDFFWTINKGNSTLNDLFRFVPKKAVC